jgi:hypothetical protein
MSTAPSYGSRPSSRRDVVSATEIASFVYCPEQWRLQHGLGNESENSASLSRGEAFHSKNASLEVRTRKASWVGLVMIALAAVLVLLARAVFLLRH